MPVKMSAMNWGSKKSGTTTRRNASRFVGSAPGSRSAARSTSDCNSCGVTGSHARVNCRSSPISSNGSSAARCERLQQLHELQERQCLAGAEDGRDLIAQLDHQPRRHLKDLVELRRDAGGELPAQPAELEAVHPPPEHVGVVELVGHWVSEAAHLGTHRAVRVQDQPMALESTNAGVGPDLRELERLCHSTVE